MSLKPNTSCQVCGKPMYKTPKRLSAGEKTTCSIACRSKLGYAKGRSRLLPDKNCEVCGKIFRPNASRRKYCSRECYYLSQHRREILVCECCGKTFERHLYLKERQGKHTYCSKDCAGILRRKRVQSECPVCGKIVERRPSELKWRNRHGFYFCCRTHSAAYQLQRKGINGLEKDFLSEFPDWRYTGDGKLWVNDNLGPMCPDFVHPILNKIIELFGNWWHRDDKAEDKIDRFRSIGWDCIVIWESEFRGDIEAVKLRVADFLQSP